MSKPGTIVVTAILTLGITACSATAPGPAATDGPGAGSVSPTTPVETPTPVATASAPARAPAPGTPGAAVWEALMGPHGEYHAVAGYAAVIEEFGPVQPYVAIAATEERHINALRRQLERFGGEVPANPYLGEVDAPPDLATAAGTWADDEVANIGMYDNLLIQITDIGLLRVFTTLRRASMEAHLPLLGEAEAKGGTLTEEQMVELGHID